MSSEGDGPRQEFQGWKEIATYLGKSVRAAQRWEQELGLPVHRLKTTAGQTVFARRDELDAWKARNVLPPTTDDRDASGPAQGASPTSRSRWVHGWRPVAVAALLICVVGVAGLWDRRARASSSVDVRVTGSTVQAIDGADRVRWARDFGPDFAPLPVQVWRSNLQKRTFDIDLDGDGNRELVVVVSSASERVRQSDRVYCLDARDGRQLWSYEPSFTLAFKGGTYSAPFVVTDVAVAAERGRDRIWLAVAHGQWWPSAVVELDRAGTAHLEYQQSGQILALVPIKQGDKWRLLAGGVNNEYAAASVAVLDPEIPAHSPQKVGSDYECVECPNGLPARYVLLPPMDTVRANGMPYNLVHDMQITGDRITINTTEAALAGVVALYTFDREMLTAEVAPGDGYWMAHREYEAQHRLAHSAENCPERLPRALRVWNPTQGWSIVQTTPTHAPLPGVAGSR